MTYSTERNHLPNPSEGYYLLDGFYPCRVFVIQDCRGSLTTRIRDSTGDLQFISLKKQLRNLKIRLHCNGTIRVDMETGSKFIELQGNQLCELLKE